MSLKAAVDRPLPSTARALWYVAPGRAELREAALPEPRTGEVLVRTLYSGISRGTERLVFEGKVPPSEYERMRLLTQEGEFSFPVKYGYAAVGTVESGPADLKGRTVFALHPHQDWFVLPASAVVPVPEYVPPRRAVLTANLETAINALWDGNAAICDRIVVVGAGLVGLLCAAIAVRIPGTEVTLIDTLPARARLAQRIGAAFALPEAAPREADLIIHTSGSDAGLTLALEIAGEEASVVEASWHGNKEVSIPLGRAFHSRRLRLISSQVGTVPASRRARWTNRGRIEAAVQMLSDSRFDDLLGDEIPFADLPRHLPRVLSQSAKGVGDLVRY